MRAKLKMKQLNFLNSLFINLSLHFVVIQFVKIEDIIARCMPRLEEFCHYRNIDVSSIRELGKRWYFEDIR